VGQYLKKGIFLPEASSAHHKGIGAGAPHTRRVGTGLLISGALLSFSTQITCRGKVEDRPSARDRMRRMAAALDDRHVSSPPPALMVVKSETASAQAIGFDPAKALRKLQSLSRPKR
jgi:hypothetical protein